MLSFRAVQFYVREIPVYGDLILSPMDGFSDLPFRLICRELGSAMSYTEFVNVDELQGRKPNRPRSFWVYRPRRLNASAPMTGSDTTA